MIGSVRMDCIHLALGPTDLRKSVDGLALIVEHILKLDPFSSHLFAFCNRRRDKIKILVWDTNGFWLLYKRLEQGSFRWPSPALGTASVCLSEREFRWLLDGLPLHQELALPSVNQRSLL